MISSRTVAWRMVSIRSLGLIALLVPHLAFATGGKVRAD